MELTQKDGVIRIEKLHTVNFEYKKKYSKL
jgi:hypothetical protein